MSKFLLWIDEIDNDESDWKLAGKFDDKFDAEDEGLLRYDDFYYWFVEELHE